MSPRSCSFTILDLPVVVRSSSPELLDRIELCYGALPRHESINDGCLQASAEPLRDGWTIHVDGRTDVRAADFVAAVRSLNHELLHGLMLRQRELFFIHAGVVAVGDDAVILPGLSRSGKSTLVLALMEQGARFLSDDLLVYEPRSRTLLPFPRAVKIRDECVDYFPGLAHRFVGAGEGRFLTFETGGHATPASPKLVVVPRWETSGDDVLHPISNGEGLLELTASALNFGSHRQQSIDHLADLAWAARCFRLSFKEPHTAARMVLQTLRGRTSSLHS